MGTDSKRGRGQRVRIVDVARSAGVSKTTAAYILSRREPYYYHYAPETVARVELAAQTLGYVKNVFAASLRLRRSPFIGVYVDHEPLQVGFSARGVCRLVREIFSGIAHVAMDRDVFPVLIARPGSRSTDEEVCELERVGEVPFVGLVVSARPELWDRVFRFWDRSLSPCVGVFPPSAPDVWGVDIDNREVGRLAARTLLDRGRRQLACLVQNNREPVVQQRLEGFRAEIEASGAALELVGLDLPGEREDPTPSRWFQQKCERATAELGRLVPDAVFATSRGATLIAATALQRLGWDSLAGCLLIGLDIPVEDTMARRILQVACPGFDLGQEAAKLLFTRLERHFSPPEVRRLSPSILEPVTEFRYDG